MKAIIFLLLVVLSFTNCSDGGLEESIIGEWKLTTVERQCPDEELVINSGEADGCVEFSNFDEDTGLTLQWETCAILVFENDRAYWKDDPASNVNSTEFTYLIDESETMVELCSSDGCLSLDYQDRTLSFVLDIATVSDPTNLANCFSTMNLRK